MSDKAHLQDISSDEELDDYEIYYSDSDESDNQFANTSGNTTNGFKFINIVNYINTKTQTNDISSVLLSDSNQKTFDHLDKQFMNALNALKCDQRLTYEQWNSRLESTLHNIVFNDLMLSATRLSDLSLCLGSLSDGIKGLETYMGCETKVSSADSLRDTSSQTDISGPIIMEDIYHH